MFQSFLNDFLLMISCFCHDMRKDSLQQTDLSTPVIGVFLFLFTLLAFKPPFDQGIEDSFWTRSRVVGLQQRRNREIDLRKCRLGRRGHPLRCGRLGGGFWGDAAMGVGTRTTTMGRTLSTVANAESWQFEENHQTFKLLHWLSDVEGLWVIFCLDGNCFSCWSEIRGWLCCSYP